MELDTIKDAFDRVAKKRKLSHSRSQEMVDQIGNGIEQGLLRIRSDHDPASPVDQKSILTELKTKLAVFSPNNYLEDSQRELNVNLTKYQKVLEKTMDPCISKAYRNVDVDPHVINQIILNHLFTEGLFDIADCFANEANEPEAISLKLQFLELHQILRAMECRSLEPAFNWVSENREKLRESGSDLELKLRKLQFLEIMQSKGPVDALTYGRNYLAPFASIHMNEVQKLMGSLLWAGKLEQSPYSDLISPVHWEKSAKELKQQFCNFLGQSPNSPLGVALAAGIEGLPTLLKLANVMAAKKQDWEMMKQLPVPVDLSREFQFHSVFVCPVSRDQASEENPPMLLPCGHVLCKQSIQKISRHNTRIFKCPYCPQEASVAQCKQIHF